MARIPYADANNPAIARRSPVSRSPVKTPGILAFSTADRQWRREALGGFGVSGQPWHLDELVNLYRGYDRRKPAVASDAGAILRSGYSGALATA